jgi:dTDP-6-deoxy-L-talose 4-dehydrogenase (NAD+)
VEDHIARRGGRIEFEFGYYPYLEYEPMAFWEDGMKIRIINDCSGFS